MKRSVCLAASAVLLATLGCTKGYDVITGGSGGSGGLPGSAGGASATAGGPMTANAGASFGGGPIDGGAAGDGSSGTGAAAGSRGEAGAGGAGGAGGAAGASGGPGGSGAAGRAADAGVGGAADAAVGACPSPALTPGDSSHTVQVGALTRSYFLHVPQSYDGSAPVPLIVDFHFLGNSGEQEQLVSPFPAATEDDAVIIAYPDGAVGPAGRAWNLGPCCVEEDVDDVAFARALVEQLRSTACIDEKRIYAVGYALGGGMAHTVGCQAADVFAAIVPVGFDLLVENEAACAPSRPITVVQFRELSDVLVPYEGGAWTQVPDMPVTLLGAAATFARWAELDGCVGPPSEQDANGCAFYEGCADGVQVVLCTRQAGMPVPDNGRVAWPILQRHALP